MISEVFRGIFINFHLILKPLTSGGHAAEVTGASALFGASNFFWILSMYELFKKKWMAGSYLTNNNITIVLILVAASFSLFIVLTTKIESDMNYVRIGAFNLWMSKVISLFYVVGSFIVLFGFILS